MRHLVERQAVTVNLVSDGDHHVESINGVLTRVQGPVARIALSGTVRPQVKDRLTIGARGYLMFRDHGGLVALRGMALAGTDGANLEFVVVDGAAQVPDGSPPGPLETHDHQITNGLRLMYISHAESSLSESDLAQILAVSRDKNQRAEITGALCYRAGFFAQILEGPEAAVREIYATIVLDDRHTDPVIATEEPTTQRLYAGWLMKGIDSDSAITAADDLSAQKGLADRDDAPQLTRRWLGLLHSQSSPAWRSEWLAARHSVLLVRELVERSAEPVQP